MQINTVLITRGNQRDETIFTQRHHSLSQEKMQTQSCISLYTLNSPQSVIQIIYKSMCEL